MATRVHAGTPVRETLSGPKAVRTREFLVAAAEAQFLDRGYWETTVEHIADAADVSRATFYTYFRSKREALEAVGKVASDAADRVFDALGELSGDWTSRDIADWVRTYFTCQREQAPWALVWLEAARVDRDVMETSRANRRYHARKIGGHLRNLGGDVERNPIYDGLMVLALLDTLWTDGHRVGGSDALIVDVAARAMEALLRRR
jgi:AcrR family transcriptional regulator